MANSDPSAVAQSHNRRQSQVLVCVEVQVRKEDADLVRDVATALGDPERESETRTILREKIARTRAEGLKALLASAPLNGIDFGRPRDLGRNLDL